MKHEQKTCEETGVQIEIPGFNNFRTLLLISIIVYNFSQHSLTFMINNSPSLETNPVIGDIAVFVEIKT